MTKRAVSLIFIIGMHLAVIAGNKPSPEPLMAMVENFQQYSDNLYHELNEPELAEHSLAASQTRQDRARDRESRAHRPQPTGLCPLSPLGLAGGTTGW